MTTNAVKRVIAVVALLGSNALASRIVHDELGHDVTVPDHAHRIVCLAPSITDTVYALGRGDSIVGITDYTKYPPEAQKKPSVGGVINPSLERLVSLKPDLILAIGDLNNADLTRAIEHLGFPVFAVDPHGLRDVYRAIEDIGRVIDAGTQASGLIASLRARESAVRQRVAGRPQPKIFFLLWPDPIMTAGRGAFISELIEIAGGQSVTAALVGEWPRLSFESLLSYQPDYVLLVRGSNVSLESLRRQGTWMRLNAVKDGKVLYADERIQFPSPMVFDALEDLANQFHPPNSH